MPLQFRIHQWRARCHSIHASGSPQSAPDGKFRREFPACVQAASRLRCSDIILWEAHMEKHDWNPAELLQLSGGYWSACALHAGVKLDLFSHAGTVSELAQATASDMRGLEMLLNALTALGLITKDGDRYAATPFAAEYLVRTSPSYLGHIIMHHHHLMA